MLENRGRAWSKVWQVILLVRWGDWQKGGGSDKGKRLMYTKRGQIRKGDEE